MTWNDHAGVAVRSALVVEGAALDNGNVRACLRTIVCRTKPDDSAANDEDFVHELR